MAPLDQGEGQPRLAALTGLRFFAAMAVVLCHFSEQGLVDLPRRLFSVLDGGRTAVSLFFVLSGFVLAYNYAHLTTTTQRRRFYVARFARIYPVVLLALLVALPSVLYATHRPDLLLSWFAIKAHTSGSLGASLIAQLTMTTGWFPVASINQPWDGPAWSVACEMFFYLCFPWLIAKLRQLSNAQLGLIAAAGCAAQALWLAALRLALPPNRSGFLVSQFPVTHLLEFVVGIASALWFIRGGSERLARGQRRTSVLAVSAVGLAICSWVQPVRPAYLAVVPLFALLVIGLATPCNGAGLLSSRPVVLLGEASYGLYLLHLPATHLLQIAGWHGSLGWAGMAVVVAASVPVFLWYETPCGRRSGAG
jgi:peptidoglycan/LPS O-acetylase OafA/YrhL